MKIMIKLLGFMKPFVPIMCVTIVMGVLGFLAAIFITVLGAYGIISGEGAYGTICVWLGVFAISRGVLRYLEQSSGHYIAFKLLAYIRDKVFGVIRKLAPSKTDSKESGQLMSLITTDIELLEVFYAHTIAPIVIAVITSGIMLFLIGQLSVELAVVAFLAYVTIGWIIPVTTSKSSRDSGRIFREEAGELNQYFLESLRGMQEILLFDIDRNKGIVNRSDKLDASTAQIRRHEGVSKAITEASILIFSSIAVILGASLCQSGMLDFNDYLISLVMLISSYGPVVALSSLSNNLLQTLAAGERVLNLLDEVPTVNEVLTGKDIVGGDISIENITFKYPKSVSSESYSDEINPTNKVSQPVLENISLKISKGEILGICGPSGCGKSTLLKLLMQFYTVSEGEIYVGEYNVEEITTSVLRNKIAFVTQDTFLFNQSVAQNLRVGNQTATDAELVEACRLASVLDFVASLPRGFDTKVGELGDTLSGGERQRLGLARAFLHKAEIILLDEPTSNLDSLNECIILNSIKSFWVNKTVIIVSHRQSTMSVADKIVFMDRKIG